MVVYFLEKSIQLIDQNQLTDLQIKDKAGKVEGFAAEGNTCNSSWHQQPLKPSQASQA